MVIKELWSPAKPHVKLLLKSQVECTRGKTDVVVNDCWGAGEFVLQSTKESGSERKGSRACNTNRTETTIIMFAMGVLVFSKSNT